MTIDIDLYLADIEKRISMAQEDLIQTQWREFADGRWQKNGFRPKTRKPALSCLKWPVISINDAIRDYDLMILKQFCGVSEALASETSSVLNIRCNYGTGILPSLFGCEPMWMADELETLPSARPLLGGSEAIKKLISEGVPDLNKGFGKDVFECGRRFMEIFEKYPMIARYVDIWAPDLQGPIDALELIWGSEIFYSFYDDVTLIQQALDVITKTYCAFMDQWLHYIPNKTPYTNYFGLVFRGKVMLREDSLVNLSPMIYRDVIWPFDEHILQRYGGGIHFCGKADHHICNLTSHKGLTAIQMTQPELNDMTVIYEYTVKKGINLIGLPLTEQKTGSDAYAHRIHYIS